MAIHFNAFREELYLEHLEEAAFQYETRLTWLYDEDIGWQDLEDIDASIEAHIDALVVGGTLALKVCLEQIPSAEASELHSIVRVFCRHKLIDRLAKLWSEFDFEDAEKVRAVADALKWECPQDWFSSLLKVFASDKNNMFTVLSPSVANLSPKSGAALVQALEKAEGKHIRPLLDDISRCDQKVIAPLLPKLSVYLNSDDVDVCTSAALTLALAKQQGVLKHCKNKISKMPLFYAIAGGLQDSRDLIGIAKSGKADEDCILALGLSGNLETVPQLLAYLKHPDLASVAARALHIISGAPLFEEVHIADEVEENELFDFELEAFKKGELPKNIDGNPFGVEVQKLIEAPAVWSEWFSNNKQQFKQGIRYRNGRVFSPTELLNTLVDNQTPTEIHKLAYEELMVRYGLDTPFAEDERVYIQQKQLNDMYYWIEKSKSLFPAGQWCFAGQVISEKYG